MPLIEQCGLKIMVDDDGYLANVDDWNEAVAQVLAVKEGIEEFTKEKMEIVRFLREYYKQYNAFPILRGVCRRVHLAKECYSEEFIDPLKAWKIAGLPKPDEHVVAEIRGEGGVV